MNIKMALFGLTLALLNLGACVSKSKYVKLQKELGQTENTLDQTAEDLEETKRLLAELRGLKPELQAKDAALQAATEQLELARQRVNELDQAQKQMEESLKSEIEQKTIRLEKLKGRLTVTFVDKILFDSGSADIKAAGKKSLKKVAESLKDMQNHNVHVEGHTDNQRIGTALAKKFPTNWELSAARATSVVRFLQEAGGLEPERLFAVGRAFYQPVAPNTTEAGRSQNRRVEIVLTPKPQDEGELAPDSGGRAP
jgi:chemotaxis protein MotB